jgi:hypothetical protein
LLCLVGRVDDSLIRAAELRPQGQSNSIVGVHDLLEDSPVRQGIDQHRSQNHDVLRSVAGGFKLCPGYKSRVVLSQSFVKLDVQSIDNVIHFSDVPVECFDFSPAPGLFSFTLPFHELFLHLPGNKSIDQDEEFGSIERLEVAASFENLLKGIGIVPGASQQKPIPVPAHNL